MSRAHLQLYTDDQKRCLQESVKHVVFENTDSFLHEFLQHCDGISDHVMSDKSDSFSVLLSQINKDNLPGKDDAESVKTRMPSFEEVTSFLVSASSTRLLTMDHTSSSTLCAWQSSLLSAGPWCAIGVRRRPTRRPQRSSRTYGVAAVTYSGAKRLKGRRRTGSTFRTST